MNYELQSKLINLPPRLVLKKGDSCQTIIFFLSFFLFLFCVEMEWRLSRSGIFTAKQKDESFLVILQIKKLYL